MGSEFTFGHEKLAQISSTHAQKWAENPRDACIPMSSECRESRGNMLVHNKGASMDLMVKKLIGAQGLVTCEVGMVPRSTIVDVKCVYGVMSSVPLPLADL